MKKNISLIVTTLIAIIIVVIGCKSTNEKSENKNSTIKVVGRDTLTLIKKIDQVLFQKIFQYVKQNNRFTSTTKNVYDFLSLEANDSIIRFGGMRHIEPGQKSKVSDIIYLMEILPDGIWTWETRLPEEDNEVGKDLDEFIATVQKQ